MRCYSPNPIAPARVEEHRTAGFEIPGVARDYGEIAIERGRRDQHINDRKASADRLPLPRLPVRRDKVGGVGGGQRSAAADAALGRYRATLERRP